MSAFRAALGLLAFLAPVPARLPKRAARKPEKGERGALAFKDSLSKFLDVAGPAASVNNFTASLLLRGQADRPLVPIFGKTESSHPSRLIPDADLKHLTWDSAREQLCGEHTYSDVTVDDCQFGKHLDWYLKTRR